MKTQPFEMVNPIPLKRLRRNGVVLGCFDYDNGAIYVKRNEIPYARTSEDFDSGRGYGIMMNRLFVPLLEGQFDGIPLEGE
jgi:hypothetical protein